ncbi:STAS-like domain-containing protein [Patescibacteria group bacterium]|nr:STAS-like domain-containing protein [Patescibacteria group bacterium]MCL5091636.1 STAS-like domain-containing protein [Patescibacteria group bacterium]
MTIELKKFGTTLISRPAGKEAWLAFQPILKNVQQDESITVDFKDVLVLTPSWADEFLTPLQNNFKNNIQLINTNNPSVKATLEILNKT